MIELLKFASENLSNFFITLLMIIILYKILLDLIPRINLVKIENNHYTIENNEQKKEEEK